LTGRTFHLS